MWIGAVIQGLGSLYGAYQQNKQNQQQKQLLKDQQNITNQQIGAANSLKPYGMEALAQGNEAYGPVLKYYTALARGDRNSILQAMAPQVQQINQQGDEARRVSTALNTRGGGNAGILAAEPYRRADSVNALALGARREGMTGLAGLASDRTKEGSGMIGALLGGLSGAASGASDTVRNALGVAGQNANLSANVGGAMADAWKQFYTWYSTRNAGTATA